MRRAAAQLRVGHVVQQPRPRDQRLHRVALLGGEHRRASPQRQLGQEALGLQPAVDPVPHTVAGRVQEGASERSSRLHVAREEVAVEDAVGRAVQRHVRRSARPRLGAAAPQQQLRERDQLGTLGVAFPVEELDPQRQLAPGEPRRLQQAVGEPSGVAVRAFEERLRLRRRPGLQPPQRGGVRVGRHGGNGRPAPSTNQSTRPMSSSSASRHRVRSASCSSGER